MHNWQFVTVLLVSWAISFVLLVKLVRSNRSTLDKIGGTLLLLVPIVGPLLYWFVYYDLPPQHPELRNRGPRGAYTHSWIAIRPILEAGLRRRQTDRQDPEGGRDSRSERK